MQIFGIEERNRLVARDDGRCMRQKREICTCFFILIFKRGMIRIVEFSTKNRR